MAEDDGTIHITTKLGHRSGKGSVVLRWGAQQGELTPEETRAHAQVLMQAAEAAEFDELFVRFFTGYLEATHAQAVTALREFRRLREQLDPDAPAGDIPPGMVATKEKS